MSRPGWEPPWLGCDPHLLSRLEGTLLCSSLTQSPHLSHGVRPRGILSSSMHSTSTALAGSTLPARGTDGAPNSSTSGVCHFNTCRVSLVTWGSDGRIRASPVSRCSAVSTTASSFPVLLMAMSNAKPFRKQVACELQIIK